MPRGKAVLDKTMILKKALDILDGHGADRLSMRTVANELGVGVMSLYHHFTTKDELIGALIDDILKEAYSPSTHQVWSQTVHSQMSHLYAVFRKHPRVTELLTFGRFRSKRALETTEILLRTLIEAGFSPKESLQAYEGLLSLLLGSLQGTLDLETQGAITKRFASLPPSEFPFITKIARGVKGRESTTDFKYALTTYIEGLEVQLRK